MKTLILADTHNQIERNENIIATENADLVIFLGDYFDSWGDTPTKNKETAKWLKESLRHSNRIHLIGNHDVSYAFHNNYTCCSGWTQEKHKSINSVLVKRDWEKLKWYYVLDGWFFTHAGLHVNHTPLTNKTLESIQSWMKVQAINANQKLTNGDYHWFYLAGKRRGGVVDIGGITWCDAREFKPIPNVKQIFGHTPLYKATWIDQSNLCLDSERNDYAIWDGKSLEIKTYNDK